MDSFRNRVALITGAASGIGRELAVTLASAGARIAALDRQTEALDSLAAELKGQTIACAVADVTDLSAVRAAVAQLEGQLGPTDLLVASAGIGIETPADAFRGEDFAAQVQVNLIGVANTIDAVLPGMCQRRRGHLAALSSMASYRGLPRMAGYCASKAGLNSLLDSLRVELRAAGHRRDDDLPRLGAHALDRSPRRARLGYDGREGGCPPHRARPPRSQAVPGVPGPHRLEAALAAAHAAAGQRLADAPSRRAR